MHCGSINKPVKSFNIYFQDFVTIFPRTLSFFPLCDFLSIFLPYSPPHLVPSDPRNAASANLVPASYIVGLLPPVRSRRMLREKWKINELGKFPSIFMKPSWLISVRQMGFLSPYSSARAQTQHKLFQRRTSPTSGVASCPLSRGHGVCAVSNRQEVISTMPERARWLYRQPGQTQSSAGSARLKKISSKQASFLLMPPKWWCFMG